MYSKAAAATIKSDFWTSFGQYMKPVANADGAAVNWVNYKTGIKHIFFRMDVDNKSASIAIEISHKDPDSREYFFEKFIDNKLVFQSEVGEDWIWLKDHYNEQGRLTAIICKRIDGVNIFKETDWPAIITFLKENMIRLDAFWRIAKEGFA